MLNITIIGAGNMGSAIATGLVASGSQPESICLLDTNTEKLEELQQKYGVQVSQDLTDAVIQADVVILAIKPQNILGLLKTLHAMPIGNTVFISIAAGVLLKTFERYLGQTIPVIRCMPNTPALVRQGMSVLCANTRVTHQQRDVATNIFTTIGEVFWIEEEQQMDSVTAISGSGPAYFFLLFTILQDNLTDLNRQQILTFAQTILSIDTPTEKKQDPFAVVFGMLMQGMLIASETLSLPIKLAHACVLQTAKGAICLAQNSERSFTELQHNVTSKGGTTEAAIAVLENQQLAEAIQQIILRNCETLDQPAIQICNIFQQAFKAACKRSQQLSIEEYG